jgi:hypothetical protein
MSQRVTEYKKTISKIVIKRLKQRRTNLVLREMGLILVVALTIGIVASVINYRDELIARSYRLPVAVQSIIGQSNNALLKKFTYDAKTKSYYLNKSGIGSTYSPPPNSITVGTNYQELPFSVKLPTNSHQGISTYDNTTGLSFTMVPKFSTLAAKQVLGHTVYPIGIGGPQAVYTLKANGLQEDVIYDHAPSSGNVKLQYQLNLPNTLQARMMPGGNLGIYSASPFLFGHISYGTPADQLDVAKARTKSTKNNLAFVLPAAEIITADGNPPPYSKYKVSLSLSGDVVTITASGLQSIHSAFSIDPSVVVTSANNNGFQNGGNNENDINFDTYGQATEAGLTGGELTSSGWTGPSSGTTNFSMAPRVAFGSVAYDGYLYVLGGGDYENATSGDCNASGLCDGVFSSQISNGSANGTWTADNVLCNTASCSSGQIYRSDWLGAVAYNGYLYAYGGYNTSGTMMDTLQYALICTGSNNGVSGCSSAAGTIGTWTTSANTLNSGAGAGLAQFSGVAYDGYIYAVGGENGSGTFQTNVLYAPIYANGNVGTWASAGTLPTAVTDLSAVVYNNYLYALGGQDGAGVYTDNAIVYAPINSNGTLGTFINNTSALSSVSGGTGLSYEASVAYDGYLYVLGGFNGSSNLSSVYYAPIYANGSIGTFISTTSFTSPALAVLGAVAYNGYLYIMGGQDGTDSTTGSCTAEASYDACNGVQYAQIASAGSLASSWSTGYSTTAMAPTQNTGGQISVAGDIYDTFYLYGGGGAGGSTCGSLIAGGAGGGGGGGAGIWSSTSINSGNTWYIGVGAGGATGASCADGGTGGESWVNTTNSQSCNYLCATGGQGGYFNYTSPPYYPAQGGTGGGASSTFSYAGYSGGTGGTSNNYPNRSTGGYSGGGGGGAAPGANGGSASGHTQGSGGTSTVSGTPNGGAGGAGFLYSASTGSNGNQGSVPGGGSSGAFQLMGGQQDGIAGQPGEAWWDDYTQTSSVVYNGWIYQVGVNGLAYDVDTAEINSNGSIGSWSPVNAMKSDLVTVTNSPYVVAYGSLVESGGYLYYLSGVNTAGTPEGTEQYAQITSGGVLSSWNVISGLTTNLNTSSAGSSYTTAVAYNGYIYLIGGKTSTPTNESDIEYTEANGSSLTAPSGCNGSLSDSGAGVWCTVSSADFLNANYTNAGDSFATTVVYDGYIYQIGGQYSTSANTDQIEYTQINTNGSIGVWSQSSSPLPSAAGAINATTVVYNGYIYQIGGVNTSGTAESTVYAAPINGSTIGSWTATTSLPTGSTYGVYRATSVANNGYIYVMGGNANNSGSVGAGTVDTEYIQINNGGTGGTISSWGNAGTANSGNLDATTYYGSSVVYNGYIYEIGGLVGGGTTASAEIEYTQISNSGAIVVPTSGCGTGYSNPSSYDWCIDSSGLPSAAGSELGNAVVYNGYIYILGGYQVGTTNTATQSVYYALICTGSNTTLGCSLGSDAGSLGTWTSTGTTGNLYNTYYWGSAVVYGDEIYVIGGILNGSYTNDIEYTTISYTGPGLVYYASTCTGGSQSDGGAGDWCLQSSTSTGALPTSNIGDISAGTVVYDGYIYWIGGYTSGTGYSTVYYNQITGGTLGTWQATNSLPAAIDNSTAVAYNGYLYLIAGYNITASATSSAVYYAAINNNGTIGSWATANNSLGTTEYGLTAVVYGGSIYELGGYNGSASQAVTYVGLQTIPLIGDYSKLIDFSGISGDDPQPIEMITYGGDCNGGVCNNDNTNPGLGGITGSGGISISYENTDDSFNGSTCGVLDNPSSLNTGYLSGGYSFLGHPALLTYNTDGCSNTTNTGRYMWVKYILDDTQTASFPDTYSNHTSISDFTVYYHPTPENRLRGGATFSNSNTGLSNTDGPYSNKSLEQSLDAAP